MIPEFTAAAAAATTQALKLITGVVDSVHDTKAKQAIVTLLDNVLDLQSKLLTIQSKYEELAEEKRTTEQELLAFQDWNAEASRYHLPELTDGIFVYLLRADRAGTEPIHFLCPHCFHLRRKQILHHPSADHTNFICDGCTFDVRPTKAPIPQFVSYPQRNRLDGL